MSLITSQHLRNCSIWSLVILTNVTFLICNENVVSIWKICIRSVQSARERLMDFILTVHEKFTGTVSKSTLYGTVFWQQFEI